MQLGEKILKTLINSKLATGQTLILNGPGKVQISAAKTVTISKIGGSVGGIGNLGNFGSLKLGASIPALGPVLGFAILTGGAALLVRQWIKKVDRGECQ